MRGRKKRGTFFVIIGLLLIAAALFLFGYNLFDEYRAGESADHILSALQGQIQESTAESSCPAESESDLAELPDYVVNPDMEMPSVEIEGHYYIGILDIPSLGLSLPVMSEWSYPNLKLAPCRYSGSAYTGNFTIAGHNYSTHFGPVRSLEAGARVIFTDLKGRSFSYQVQAVETLEPTAIEDMLSEEWDLTLFTCTPGGQARVAIRCLKAD